SSLEGHRPQKDFSSLLADPLLRNQAVGPRDLAELYVTCQLFADNNPLTLPIKTAYRSFQNHWTEADGNTATTTPANGSDESEMDRLEREYNILPATVPRMIDAEYYLVDDPESMRDNPVENKHRKLARSHRNGPLDRDLKPNPKLRDDLNALTKFLKCVEWQDPVEAKQAVDLTLGWAEIDVEDALELLGESFHNPQVRSYAVLQLTKAEDEDLQLYLLQLVQALKFESITEKSGIHESPLADFLIDRSIKNPILGNYFYWYLMVECEDKKSGRMFAKVTYQFMAAMVEVPDGIHRRETLARQADLVETLTKISKEIRLMKEPRPRKVIFKTGDDLRQDQLVVQVIMLMDKLLRKENLDLRLTPYKVLATGVDVGMSQFIPSESLGSIISEYGSSLSNYLRAKNGNDIPASVVDNYVRSCGSMFHVDFGFILGRDPKPFPPPMKLSKEMVDVMGGTASPLFQKFKAYCFVAYNNLRKSASLILNLFALMVSANVPDIALEPDKAVLKVQEKFRLDLSEEEAMQFFQQLISESIGAVFPQVMERIHQVAQLLRS
ncbi:Phosphatidylinositol (PI) 3-kinase, partial [Cladochytrium tenue]